MELEKKKVQVNFKFGTQIKILNIVRKCYTVPLNV